MFHSIPYRRFFALAAIYVVVLQALLLPLAVAAGGPLADSLCISSSADTHGTAGHDTGCPCAAGCGTQCCGQGVVGAAPGSLVIASTLAGILTPALALEPVAPAAERHPQNPRAPPAA
jgi:hypothetical protein